MSFGDISRGSGNGNGYSSRSMTPETPCNKYTTVAGGASYDLDSATAHAESECVCGPPVHAKCGDVYTNKSGDNTDNSYESVTDGNTTTYTVIRPGRNQVGDVDFCVERSSQMDDACNTAQDNCFCPTDGEGYNDTDVPANALTTHAQVREWVAGMPTNLMNAADCGDCGQGLA